MSKQGDQGTGKELVTKVARARFFSKAAERLSAKPNFRLNLPICSAASFLKKTMGKPPATLSQKLGASKCCNEAYVACDC